MMSWRRSAFVPCVAVNWASPKPNSPTPSASPARPSRVGGRPTPTRGVSALPHRRSGRPCGSGRVLSDAQAEHIQQLLRTHQPQELGIAAPLWTRRAVGDLIRREYNLALAVRTIGRYLQRWGFTTKRPRRHARDQDPEEVRQWLEETYPAIAARAEREGAEIHWGDEVGVAADQTPTRGYAPQGQPATLDVPDRHVRVNQISTITNAGEVRFMTYT